MSLTRVEDLAAGGDGDNLFGGGQAWPNGPDGGAEEAPGQLGCGRLAEALGDEQAWMW